MFSRQIEIRNGGHYIGVYFQAIWDVDVEIPIFHWLGRESKNLLGIYESTSMIELCPLTNEGSATIKNPYSKLNKSKTVNNKFMFAKKLI